MNTTVAMAVTASATTICQNGPDDRQHGAHRLHLLTADDDAHGGRLLPAPLAPTNPVIRPGTTSNDTSSRTVVSPYVRLRDFTLNLATSTRTTGHHCGVSQMSGCSGALAPGVR